MCTHVQSDHYITKWLIFKECVHQVLLSFISITTGFTEKCSHHDHSDIMTSCSTGHVDFYPNGGAKQPGCSKKRNTVLFPAISFIKNSKYSLLHII